MRWNFLMLENRQKFLCSKFIRFLKLNEASSFLIIVVHLFNNWSNKFSHIISALKISINNNNSYNINNTAIDWQHHEDLIQRQDHPSRHSHFLQLLHHRDMILKRGLLSLINEWWIKKKERKKLEGFYFLSVANSSAILNLSTNWSHFSSFSFLLLPPNHHHHQNPILNLFF